MLTLAAIALILPTAVLVASGTAAEGLGTLSVSISAVLLFVYLLNLRFALMSHSSLFEGSHDADDWNVRSSKWSVRTSAVVLAGATALIAWISEILVGAIEPVAREFGLSNVFVGVFVVAVVGNAAEHATAITAATKDRMDLSLSIAIGSSVQIALLVAPVLVFASLFIGPVPLDLALSGRPRPDGVSLGTCLRPSRRRRTIRLAQGRATARSLPDPRPHLFSNTERGAPLMRQGSI